MAPTGQQQLGLDQRDSYFPPHLPTLTKLLTFMVGGAVRGGDSGRSGKVTSELLASSCFL